MRKDDQRTDDPVDTAEKPVDLEINTRRGQTNTYDDFGFSDEEEVVVEVQVGEEILYDDDAMRGRVIGFEEVDGQRKVQVMPTHLNGVPLTPEQVHDYLDEDKNYQSWSQSRIKKFVATVRTVPEEGVDIAHFSPTVTTASEYVIPHGDNVIGPRNSIEITNHGLGSGIYGVAHPPSSDQSDLALTYNPASKAYTIHLSRPFFLQDMTHGEEFTSVSKDLQRMAQAFRDHNGVSKDISQLPQWIAQQPKAGELAARLVAVLARAGLTISADQAADAISNALGGFFKEYYAGNPTVAQPVNFLFGNVLGYDGVYADDPHNNSFSRGLVAYTVPTDTPKTTRADRPT